VPTKKSAEQKGRDAVAALENKLERLEVSYVAVDAIRPNGYNPNRQNEHEFTLLCKSMQEDGFVQPIMVTPDGVIVDGEHRWRAAAKIGLPEIPVVYVPMEELQAKRSTLRMNRARGSEDIEIATELFRDFERMGQLDWATAGLDMSDEEVQRLLADISAPDEHAAEEFGDAWAPAAHGNASGGGEGQASADMTPAAVEAQREQEQRLREAKTEEERQALLNDNRMYRLVLTFSGDEADVVREALGESPAQRVLEWCRSTVTTG
jgi:ParB-like chromosome segregation protein Spo0J